MLSQEQEKKQKNKETLAFMGIGALILWHLVHNYFNQLKMLIDKTFEEWIVGNLF